MNRILLLMICSLCLSTAYTYATVIPVSRVSSVQQTTGKVIAKVQWKINKKQTLLCQVSVNQNTSQTELPVYRMEIMEEKAGKSVRFFEFSTVFPLLSIFPVKEMGGKLFVTWTGGSAYSYHLHAFEFANGGIRNVLEMDAHYPPEILLDRDGNEMLLITEDATSSGERITILYVWRKDRFQPWKRIPWEDRLEAANDYIEGMENVTIIASDPTNIIKIIKTKGAKKTVDRLTRNLESWDKTLHEISKGDPAWLEVARLLRPGTDAFMTTTLELAVANALPRNPRGVLRLIGPSFTTMDVCTVPTLEASTKETLEYVNQAEIALESEIGPELDVVRKDCLAKVRNFRK